MNEESLEPFWLGERIVIQCEDLALGKIRAGGLRPPELPAKLVLRTTLTSLNSEVASSKSSSLRLTTTMISTGDRVWR